MTTKSIRVTKEMARNAAQKMAAKVYNEKYNEQKTAVRSLAEELAKKYIPTPVLACIKEYEDYFSLTDRAHFYIYETNKFSHDTISVTLNFNIPYSGNYIVISKQDYIALKKVDDRLQDIIDKKAKFEEETFNALFGLRTTKNINEAIPEAMEYLELPEDKSLPIPVYQNIRQLLNEAKC